MPGIKAAASAKLMFCKSLTAIILLTAIGLPACAQSDTDQAETLKREFRKLGLTAYSPARNMPSFETVSANGGRVRLSDFRGKIVFLNFWATWCPPCLYEMPSIERLHNFFKGRDFAVLAVSVGEEPSAVSAFLRENAYTFTVTCNPDNSLARLYASRGIPSTYILNKKGEIIASRLGAREWDAEECLALFAKLLE